jgi:hypothetical protein
VPVRYRDQSRSAVRFATRGSGSNESWTETNRWASGSMYVNSLFDAQSGAKAMPGESSERPPGRRKGRTYTCDGPDSSET